MGYDLVLAKALVDYVHGIDKGQHSNGLAPCFRLNSAYGDEKLKGHFDLGRRFELSLISTNENDYPTRSSFHSSSIVLIAADMDCQLATWSRLNFCIDEFCDILIPPS